MFDQEKAEELTRQIQAALSAGDVVRAVMLSRRPAFAEFCKTLRISPAAAVAAIKQSLGPKTSGQ